MYPRYYALRRLNPYRGVVQVAEAGEATAHSFDGVTWHIRSDDGYGWVRPAGVWVENEGLVAGQPGGLGDILAALQTRPALPFPLADTLELWLLDKADGLPLALLASALPSRFEFGPIEPEWHPFALSYTGFHSSNLAEAGVSPQDNAHRHYLARLIKEAARPHPAAQWFRRGPAGEGEGREGLRLAPEWAGRRLGPENFPELLLREPGNSRLEKSAIADYHLWLAPLFLLLPGLSEATRDRLEAAAAVKQPQGLLKVHRLLPRVLDPERLRAALVAARLEAASGGQGSSDLFAY